MADSTGQAKRPSPKAEEAFRQYVALGPSRSLRKLADALLEQKHYKTSATALATVNKWSSEHRWQERLADAASERAERMLREAADLDAETFLRTSREAHRRSEFANGLQMRDLLSMREAVRKPAPKGGTSVSVNVSVEVRHLAEQIAKEMGIDASELIADAEQIAQREWDKAGKA